MEASPVKFQELTENSEEDFVLVRRSIPVLAVIMLAFVFAAPAGAQSITDKIEVFGGYSFMHYKTSPTFNTNGWELSGEYKVRSWLGGFADVDGHYGTVQGVHSTVHDYLFGPQVSFPAPVSPFARVFVGDGTFSGGGVSDSSLAYGLGFGIDAHVVPQVSWRIVQFDVVHTHLFNQSESNTRVGTGIVIHF